MRTLKTTKKLDAAQLRQELAHFGPGVVVKEDVAGEVSVEVDDSKVDGRFVDLALRQHFPRSLITALDETKGSPQTAAWRDAVTALLKELVGERTPEAGATPETAPASPGGVKVPR